jgi:CNT family concentrative nucleoside transporter
MERLIGLFGIVFLLGVAWLVSENRKKIRGKVVLFGISLQILIALFVLKTAPGKWVFEVLNDAVGQMLSFTSQGSMFVFGKGLLDLGSFALVILPTIVFFSAFFTVLYYFGILQFVVKIFAVVLRRLLGTSGAEALSTAANVFMGQTEAPLMIKPYVEKMTRSELMCVMTGGMATVAGGVLAAYVGMGIEAGHLIAASVMNAPAAIVFAKILVPETGHPLTADVNSVKIEITDKNPIEAASRGASEGLFLAMNVAAMLLAFVAFVALFNAIFGLFGTTMQEVLGTVMRPVAFLMGVPWEDSAVVGTLLGEKTVINEFIAYQHLGEHMRAASLANVHQNLVGGLPFVGEFISSGAAAISHKASVITTYALCGFANFSSIAIQLGGIGSMAPTRRGEIASLGLRAMLAGTLATFLSGTIAGILL